MIFFFFLAFLIIFDQIWLVSVHQKANFVCVFDQKLGQKWLALFLPNFFAHLKCGGCVSGPIHATVEPTVAVRLLICAANTLVVRSVVHLHVGTFCGPIGTRDALLNVILTSAGQNLIKI